MNAAVRTTSLRFQLVILALAGVLVPLLLGGLILFFLLASRLDATVSVLGDTRRAVVQDLTGPDLAALAHNVAGQLDEYLLGRIFEATAWAASDVVVVSARKAYQRHLDAGFDDLSIEQIEDRFPIAKSLGAFPDADAYLRAQISASPDFAEAFFTDQQGYNVALTNPTSDFVQSDEDWWLRAWRHKIAVGKVEFDESAGVWSVDIAIRIDDSVDQTPLGVLKSVLSIKRVQQIADRNAESLAGARVVVTTGDGLLIAETTSNHARERIMSESTNVREHGSPALQGAFGAERSGSSTDDGKFLTAHARTAGGKFYAPVTPRFPGFDWLVIIQRPLRTVLAPLGPLAGLADEVVTWPWVLGAGLAAVSGLIVTVMLAGCLAFSRRWAADIAAIAAFAQGVATGERVRRPSSLHASELVELDDAVHQLYRVFVAVLRKARNP